jgi:lysyl endopeptidase
VTMAVSLSTIAQISQGGIPFSFEANSRKANENYIKSSDKVPIIHMPLVDQKTIDEIKEQNRTGAEIFQFAYGLNVNIKLKDTAVVDSLKSGLLYRLSIESVGAKSINIIFKDYQVPLGAKLFLYSGDQMFVKGAFTSNNNKKSNKLPTEPIAGDLITIEYFEPYFSDFQGRLTIGKVSHDFVGIVSEDGQFGTSGDCHVDINCPEGGNWQNEKQAVCRITINGQNLCSGALLNNTAEDGTPYFLTANHCISTQVDAENSVFVFNYESPTCGGIDGSVSQSISGADLRATREGSDFTLLELSKLPIATWNSYYAGWDRNDIQGAGGVGIHHPSGDVKKISTFNMVPIDSDCIDPILFPQQNNFYLINDWLETQSGHGVTEGGSSGSPLFNNNGLVIGQLYGGCEDQNENCDDPFNDVSNYGKIFSSWDLGGAAENQLQNWLDPSNGNLTTLNGLNVCQQIVSEHLNLTQTFSSGTVTLQLATATITSTSTVESGATVTYEAGETITLEPGFVAEAGSNFIAQIEPSPNCIEGCYQMTFDIINYIFSSGGNLCLNQTNAQSYNLTLTTVGTGDLVYQTSGSVDAPQLCIPMPDNLGVGVYNVLLVLDNDCEELSHTYQVQLIGSNGMALDTSDASIDNEQKTLLDSFDQNILQNIDFEIYPNPNSGDFTIDIKMEEIVSYSFEIINSLGLSIYRIDNLKEPKISIDKTSLSSGVYYIRIINNKNAITKKVIVQL